MNAINSIGGLVSAAFGAFLSEIRFAGRLLLGLALGYPLRAFIFMLAVAVALASIM